VLHHDQKATAFRHPGELLDESVPPRRLDVMKDADREGDIEELVAERSCSAVIDHIIGPRIALAGTLDDPLRDVDPVEGANLVLQILVGEAKATADVEEPKRARIAEPPAGEVDQIVRFQLDEEVEVLTDEVDRLLDLVFVCVLLPAEVDGHKEPASSSGRRTDSAGSLRPRLGTDDRAGSLRSAGKPYLLRTM
jgi:hypothetical protein